MSTVATPWRPGRDRAAARRVRPPHRSVRLQLVSLLLLGVGLHAADSPPQLWYAEPAAKWEEALPVGNGHLGAMIFGGLADERIQFNESTLWTGQPHDYVRAGARDALPEIRRLIAEGKTKDAEKLVREKFLSDPVRQKAYQPCGDLRLQFPEHGPAARTTDYRRTLDLDAGVVRVGYRQEGVAYSREVFASHPANALVVRLTADVPGKISFTARLSSPHRGAGARTVGADTLAIAGQVQPGGVRFEARVRAIATGGKLVVDENGITVDHADNVTLVLTAATSFRNYEDIGADPAERCAATLAKIARATFDALRAAHVADHQGLFRRVKLELGETGAAARPTNERLRDVKRAGLAADPALPALFFDYGRYLLIASSRPGGQPANLQGIWNELLDPPWESKWTTNINLEMNYWPAEVTNLAECHEPLFDLIDDLVVSGGRTAREQYGAGGWVLHHNTDLWRGTAPINNIDGVWPTGGAWLCAHLWDHFLFSGDRDFLARRAYPAMKSAAQFFVDTLVEEPTHHWLVTTPSYSPEQGSLVAGPTMDIQLVRALFRHTRMAAALLGRDADFAARLADLERRLPPNQVGKHGQLQEWLEDVDRPNNNHRHMSPLWALYPGDDITPAEPEIWSAAKKLLAWRGDGSTGWSYAWRMPLWARVGDGEMAYRQLAELMARKTLPNLFDLCGPFQIDGNFGAAAGIAEMLVQSRFDPVSGGAEVKLLPALPKAWPQGSVTGLRARGDYDVDLAWRGGELQRAVIRAQRDGPIDISLGAHHATLTTHRGESYPLDRELHPSP
jgi:alpha-L-fucosidase 2